jgi:O-acetyl-ADP-ribose deacetylase (regulator of RNase III)
MLVGFPVTHLFRGRKSCLGGGGVDDAYHAAALEAFHEQQQVAYPHADHRIVGPRGGTISVMLDNPGMIKLHFSNYCEFVLSCSLNELFGMTSPFSRR